MNSRHKPEPLLDTLEVAEWLGKKRSWMEDNRDAIPFIRVGRECRYDPADVREYIRKHRVAGGEPAPDSMVRVSTRSRRQRAAA